MLPGMIYVSTHTNLLVSKAYTPPYISVEELEPIKVWNFNWILELAARCLLLRIGAAGVLCFLILSVKLAYKVAPDWWHAFAMEKGVPAQVLMVNSGALLAKRQVGKSLDWRGSLPLAAFHLCGHLFVGLSQHIERRQCQHQKMVLVGSGGRRGEVGLGRQCMLGAPTQDGGLTALAWFRW